MVPAPTDPASAARRVAEHLRGDSRPHHEDLLALLSVLDAVARAASGDRLEGWANAMRSVGRPAGPHGVVADAADLARMGIALAGAEAAELTNKVRAYLAAVDRHRSEDDQWGPGRAYQPVRDAREAADEARAALDAAVRGM